MYRSPTAFNGVDFSVIKFSSTNERYHVDGKFIYRHITDTEYELLSVSQNFGGKLVVPDFVIGLAADSVRANANITGLVVGRNVSYVGSSAFYGCKRLSDVSVGGGDIGGSVFYGCDGLSSVVLGEGVTSVGGHAFCNCTNLLSVAIPDSVTNIGSSAFYGCKRLSEVSVGGGDIGRSAFYGCDGLSNVVLEEGVTSIGADAFYNCTNLLSVAIPCSVTSIGSSAFYGCKRL